MNPKSDNPTSPDTCYLLLDTFKEYLILKGHAKRTREGIIKTVSYFAQWAEKENIELQNISYNDMIAYVNHCKKKGNKQSTIQKAVINIKHYYDFLMNENQTEDNPCTNIAIKGIKRKTLRETFTPEELENIYQSYQSTNPLIHKRNKAIVGLIIYQGLRTEELERLTPQDIKIREGKINIEGSSQTNPRELKLEAHQIYDLMDYINETRKILLIIRGKESNKLFISTGNGYKFNNMMQKLMKQLRKKNSKLKDLTQLRTSVISNWLKQYNTRKVQVMTGHRYISSTEAYKENNMDSLIEDINKYHPIS